MSLVEFAIIFFKALVVFGVVVMLVPLLIWAERRGAAMIQNRRGPNRVTFFGFRNAI